MLTCPKSFYGVMRLFESKSLSQGEGEEQVMGLFGYGKTSPWAFLEKVQEGRVKL